MQTSVMLTTNHVAATKQLFVENIYYSCKPQTLHCDCAAKLMYFIKN